MILFNTRIRSTSWKHNNYISFMPEVGGILYADSDKFYIMYCGDWKDGLKDTVFSQL